MSSRKGSTLTRGLRQTAAACVANRRVDSVSPQESFDGDTVANIAVLAFPMKHSFNKRVKIESRNPHGLKPLSVNFWSPQAITKAP